MEEKEYKLNEVFGVRKNILSYVRRKCVDDRFKMALESDKQIIVYGASKQGKTALVEQHCTYNDHIVYQITPSTELHDIYSYILNQAGLYVAKRYSTKNGRAASKYTESTLIINDNNSIHDVPEGDLSFLKQYFNQIPFNIDQAQSVADLLKSVNYEKIIILENFHYLSNENQVKFSFDLRAFQELGVRFIILGVWRERNRLSQFNGDLLERVKEIPVEPWHERDFARIAKLGGKLLNIRICRGIVEVCCESSFASVAVFQDLIKSILYNHGIEKTKINFKEIEHSASCIKKILDIKTESYGDRHKMSLQALASGGENNTKQMPYYIVLTILKLGLRGISKGLSINEISKNIKKIHPDPKLKVRYIRTSLKSLGRLQTRKKINPPIIAFDDNADLLHVTDSTLYFYLQNADLDKCAQDIEDSFN